MELGSSVERTLGECPFEFTRYPVRACTVLLVIGLSYAVVFSGRTVENPSQHILLSCLINS